MKRFILILLAVAIVIGGGALLKKDSKTSKANSAAAPSNHIYSQGSTGVKLVEYGDFQCPGCGAFYPILKEVKEKYKDQISFQFVNFPLTQIHQNAQAGARAAQAASNQGKFWEMHNLLYENQKSWEASTNIAAIFDAYAAQLGLDIAKFKIDFASAATNAIINADVKSGQDLKITGTPTFFLDGKQIENNNTVASLEKFSAVIDAEILAKTGKPSTTANTPATNQ